MTILFKEDWSYYPGAIVDTQTANQSFVRLAGLYKSMGIENHAFILALHNPELQGIDPYDENLPREIQDLIALECKENFWYFLREIARVPNTDNDYLRANRGMIALAWCYLAHIPIMLIQPRQTGKSLMSDEVHAYNLGIAGLDYYIGILTKDETLRSAQLARIKSILEGFPYYLRMLSRGDIANTEEIYIKALNNRLKAVLPNKSPKAATNVGRGLTAHTVQIDEIAFIYNLGISMPAMLPVYNSARRVAEKRGMPYGLIFTTTAGKKDDIDGRYAYDLLQRSMVWTEFLFDCQNIEDAHATVRHNSPSGELRINATFSHRQLGYTDQWLKETLELTNSRGEDALRDFFNLWTDGNQHSPFKKEEIDKIKSSANPKIYHHIHRQYNYALRVQNSLSDFEHRLKNEPVFMGLDSSDAAGNDDIGIVFVSVYTGEVLAAANINETNMATFISWLAEMMIEYPKLILVPERRSSAATVLDILMQYLIEEGENPFFRIFNTIVNSAHEDPTLIKNLQRASKKQLLSEVVKHKSRFGFATSGSGMTSRTSLYSKTLYNAVEYGGDKIGDDVLIRQLMGLTIRNGRVDHQPGEHDDLVIAWLLAYWLMLQGSNLSYYGIRPTEILKSNFKRGQNRVEESKQLRIKQQQDAIMAEIDVLKERLEKETNPMLISRLEARMLALSQKIQDDNIVHSVEQILEALREKRKEKSKSAKSNFMNRSRYGLPPRRY